LESVFLDNINKRSGDQKRNELLDKLIEDLKSLLEPVQQTINADSLNIPDNPVGLIIGNPRSGTTLLQQYLASTGAFSYPTNLLARFSYAPYIGAQIQKLLFNEKYSHQKDMSAAIQQLNFSSDLGKSKGILAPNEFFHFWRRFIPTFDLEYLSENILKKVDFQNIGKEFAQLDHNFEKPFICKGLFIQNNLLEFYRKMNYLFFIYIKRDPLMVMQSIYQSRKRFYNRTEIWWSVKPREYSWLKDMDVFQQIAGQVYFNDLEIKNQLHAISERHKIEIEYSEFCDQPESFYLQLKLKYAELGSELSATEELDKLFTPNTKISLDTEEKKKFVNAYDMFESGKLKFES